MPPSTPRTTVLRPRAPEIFAGSYAVGPVQELAARHSVGSLPRAGHHDPAAVGSQEFDDKETLASVARDAILLAPSDCWRDAIKDCFDYRVWLDPVLWSAGLIEFAASMAFAFTTGAVGVTLSSYPLYILGPAAFVANTASVALFIYALSTASGAHINPLISIATTFSGLCHPVRGMVYVVCQAAGSIIGGAFLRVGLGYERAVAVHNGGCFLDPDGTVTVGQAAAIEFMAAFSLLLIAFGVGLDPRQKRLYGASLGPALVGMTVGLLTSGTSALNEGYTGAGIFPGRCLGLQVGIGQVYSHDWVWWVPDIAAALMHSLLYRFAPPYKRIRSQPPACSAARLNGELRV